MGAIAENLRDKDKAFIDEWLDKRWYIISFVAGVMRSGILEEHYNDSLQLNAKVGLDLGMRVFSEGATKYKQMRPSAAIKILAQWFIGIDVISWFKYEGKLDNTIAVKAVLFELGVDENTLIPQGCENGDFLNPLLPVFTQRRSKIGPKLHNISKDSLDSQSDWFCLKQVNDETTIFCNATVPPKEMELAWLNISQYDDWLIAGGNSYTDALLMSTRGGIELNLARQYELHAPVPIYHTPFDFPPKLESPTTTDMTLNGHKKRD